MTVFKVNITVTGNNTLYYCDTVWYGQTRMVWLPNMVKKIEDMFSHFDRIPACDRQADRQTKGQTDGQTNILPHYCPRYAYASRGKNRLQLFSASCRCAWNSGIESHRRQLCVYRKNQCDIIQYNIGHHTRLLQSSHHCTLRLTLKYVSAFGMNNIKWRRWM